MWILNEPGNEESDKFKDTIDWEIHNLFIIFISNLIYGKPTDFSVQFKQKSKSWEEFQMYFKWKTKNFIQKIS